MRQIPNILSALRIGMVGVLVYCFLNEKYMASLIIYVLAVLTDLLDGYLARRNDWITDVGKVLDPLADKLMLISVFICFYLKSWLPLWLVIIVVGKELLMIVGGILLFKREVVVYADWYGKFATGFFNLGVVLTFCKRFWHWVAYWNIVLLIVAATLAIVALVHYARKNMLPHIRQTADMKPEDEAKTP